ncbi:MAG: SdiA-regulated domain-containing protein [Flavisolibacter sp.]
MMKKLIQTKCPVPIFFILVYALTLLTGCKRAASPSPEGYDLNKPREMQLGKVLNEISGLSFNEEDSSLSAISDSKQQIFRIGLKNQKLRDQTGPVVGPDSDVEDLVKWDHTTYLLSSWGEIHAVPDGVRDTTGVASYDLGLPGQNDFETLYYDPTARGLVMMCKNCAEEKGKGIKMAFLFDLQTKKFDSSAFFTISRTDIEALLKDKDARFEPSAAAIHPINKRLYILSAPGKLLVVTDTRGKVMEAYKLNPDKFPQAEGIAFAPNGDMYISNEGKFGRATLLFFPYHSGRKHK